jgi:DNA-binding MarR family transcriptional regulator
MNTKASKVHAITLDSVIEDMQEIMSLMNQILRVRLGKIELTHLDTNLSFAHWRIISVLQETGTCHISEVADALTIPRPMMTYLVDRLVSLNLVERVLDSADRRKVNISLTEFGRAMLGEHQRLVEGAFKSAISHLSHKEMQEFSESLKKLKELLAKIG